MPKAGANAATNTPRNAANAPRNAAAAAPAVGNPVRDVVVAAPPQEPVAAKMKGGVQLVWPLLPFTAVFDSTVD